MKHVIPWLGRILLIVAFSALALVVTIEARGWRFNQRNLHFVRTGMLIARYSPEDAVLLIDGQPIDHKSPIALPNLLPGRYDLELRKDGYTSWTKSITIEPERVVAEIGMVLFVNQPMIEQLTDPQDITRLALLLAGSAHPEANPSIHNQVELWNNDQLITRLSAPVSSVQWLVEDEFVIFQQGKQIRLIAADGTNDRTLYGLSSDVPAPLLVEHRGRSIVVKDGEHIARITVR